MQANMVREEFRVLHLDLQEEATLYHNEHSLSIGDLEVLLHRDALPPTRPHLLIVPLSGGTIFFQTTRDPAPINKLSLLPCNQHVWLTRQRYNCTRVAEHFSA